MRIADLEDYGPLEYIVSGATAAIGASAAVMSLWRPRLGWEPDIEELPRAPQQVALVASAAGIAILWLVTRDGRSADFAIGVLVGSLTACVTGLISYLGLISMLRFRKEIAVDGQLKEINVVGGFRLTPSAKETIQSRALTHPEAFKGMAYDPDEMWTRSSRSAAKVCLVVAYLLFVAGGSITVASTGVVIAQ